MAAEVKSRRPYNAALRREQALATRSRILEAARRLLAKGTYGAVTMEDIAREAGVSYQTVYAIFGTKLRLAQAIIEAGWPHVEAALKLIEEARISPDPEVWLRVAARVSRRILEPCADLMRFMRESGDPSLRQRYQRVETERYKDLREVADLLGRSGRLRRGLTQAEALDILWAMTGPDWYSLLVFQRRWKPPRYEEWLRDALIAVLLEPAVG
jgi:AcrR family transcriptional regulator